MLKKPVENIGFINAQAVHCPWCRGKLWWRDDQYDVVKRVFTCPHCRVSFHIVEWVPLYRVERLTP